MSATSRVAGAVAAGYVLGRFKKLRFAVLVGSTMASPKFRSAAAGMIQDRLPGGTVVGTMTKEVGGKLINVGKTAATSIVASRIDSLSQSLADRSQNLRIGAPDGQAGKSRADEPADRGSEEPEDQYEEQEGSQTEEPEDQYEEQEGSETAEPEDQDKEQEGSQTAEPEDQNAQAEDDASRDEEPEEPVARSPRRRRSTSPAGRRRG